MELKLALVRLSILGFFRPFALSCFDDGMSDLVDSSDVDGSTTSCDDSARAISLSKYVEFAVFCVSTSCAARLLDSSRSEERRVGKEC